MSDQQPFEISADFAQAISEFDKLANANDRLNRRAEAAAQTFRVLDSANRKLISVTTETSDGVTRLTSSVVNLTEKQTIAAQEAQRLIGGLDKFAQKAAIAGKAANTYREMVTRTATGLNSFTDNQTKVFNSLDKEIRKLRVAKQQWDQYRGAMEAVGISKAKVGGISVGAEMFPVPFVRATVAGEKSADQARAMLAALQDQAADKLYARREVMADRLTRPWDAPQQRARGTYIPWTVESLQQQRGLERLGNRAIAADTEKAVESERARRARLAEAQRNVNVDNPLGRIQIRHLAGIYLGYRAMNALRQGFEDTAGAAHKLNQAIGEIQTISQKSGISFERFREQILSVSSAFGLAAEDVAEAQYQAISNQVVDAAHSFQFMSDAAALAVTTQSSLADSVNLLSSVLNSYGMKADRAEQVSASLFKAIELGRIRSSELANTYGNVTVLAAELGVNLDELNTSMAALTVNGVKTDTAMTFLRGVFQKMVKPTEEMNELFTEWGVSSGQAAIQTFGWMGVLQKLTKEFGGSAARAGELFNYIRALQGALALTGSNMEGVVQTMEKFQLSASEFANAKKIMLDTNPAIQFNKELQGIRNAFIRVFSIAQEALISLNSAGVTLSGLMKLTALLALAATLRMALFKKEVIGATAALEAQVATTIKLRGLQADLGKESFLGLGAVGKANAISLGLSAITLGLIYLAEEARKAREEFEAFTQKALADTEKRINDGLVPAFAKLNAEYRKQLQTLAEYRSKVSQAYSIQEVHANAALERMRSAVKSTADVQQEAISKLKNELNELNNSFDKSVAGVTDLGEAFRRADFEKRLAGAADDGERERMLELEIELASKRAQELAASGDPKKIDNARQLQDQAIADAKRLKGLREARGAEATPADKSGAQLMAENMRNRKLGDLRRLNNTIGSEYATESEKSAAKAEKEKVLAELEALDKQISTLEAKRDKRGQREQGKVDTDTKIKTLQDERIALEEAYQAAVSKTTAVLETKLRREEELFRATKAYLEDLTHLTLASADIIARFVKAFTDFTGMGFRGPLAPQAAEAKAELEKLVGLRTERERVTAEQDAKQAEIKKLSQIQAEAGAKGTASTQQKMAVAKALAEYTAPALMPAPDDENIDLGVYTAYPGPGTAVASQLIRRAKDMQKRAEAAMALGDTAGTQAAYDWTDEELSQLKPFANPQYAQIIAGSRANVLVQAANAAGFSHTPKPDAFTPGAIVTEFEKVLSAAGHTTSEFTKQLAPAPPAISSFVESLLKANAEFEAMTGIKIGGDKSKAEDKSDADMVDGDSRAHGGFSLRGGVHHPGEYIVNARETRKYRGLLELMNRGDEGFMLGQAGGRTGGADFRRLMDDYVFATVNGMPAITGVSNRHLGYAGGEPSRDYVEARGGLIGLLERSADRFGGDPDSYIQELLGRNLKPYSSNMPMRQPANYRQDYSYRFGDININGANQNVRQLADAVMVEIRRSLARGTRTL